jgi:hypothetical protein
VRAEHERTSNKRDAEQETALNSCVLNGREHRTNTCQTRCVPSSGRASTDARQASACAPSKCVPSERLAIEQARVEQHGVNSYSVPNGRDVEQARVEARACQTGAVIDEESAMWKACAC